MTYGMLVVDHGHEWPYVILSECAIFCDEAASKEFAAAHDAGKVDQFLESVLKPIVDGFDTKPLSERIDDHLEKFVGWQMTHPNGNTFKVIYTYRRLGEDNGMSTLVHLDNNLRMAFEHLKAVIAEPQA